MTNTNALPTKTQIDNLIATCLSAGYNEAAGLMTLASESISENVKRDTEETCCCYEIMGDNPKCPKHGGMFKDHGAVDVTDKFREICPVVSRVTATSEWARRHL